MSFASQIPVYDSVPLVDFGALERQFVHTPVGASLRAWQKLDELERRLDTFDWSAMVIRDPRRGTHLINDLAFSYVLGFEATLQILKEEWKPAVGFDPWLKTLASYDIRCRGIQALRNLDAHIRAGQITAGSGRGAYSRFYGGSYSGHAVGWRLPEISDTELALLKPHGRRLDATELPAWNALVNDEFATESMREGLISLVSIVEAAK